MTVEERIRARLAQEGASFREIEHPAAYDAEQAAAVRGTALSIGGKALVMKLDRVGFVILGLPADRVVDNRALRHHLRVRRYRFATADELAAVTGLAPGCIPPFGRPVFDLPLYVDPALAGGSEIGFTPGVHTRSFVMATADWLRAARPVEVFPFAG